MFYVFHQYGVAHHSHFRFHHQQVINQLKLLTINILSNNITQKIINGFMDYLF